MRRSDSSPGSVPSTRTSERWSTTGGKLRLGKRSVDVAPEAHRGLALDEPPRRHDQHAIVIGGAHLAFIIAADQGAFFGEDFEPVKIAGEIEARAGDRYRLGHLDDPLAGMRVEIGAAERGHILLCYGAERDQEAQGDIGR